MVHSQQLCVQASGRIKSVVCTLHSIVYNNILLHFRYGNNLNRVILIVYTLNIQFLSSIAMDDYFVPTENCPMSEDLLHHSSITTIHCGPCGLRNPNFKKTSFELPNRLRIKHESDPDIIEIEDSPLPKPLPPVKRRGTATQVPPIKDFKSGYAEHERQVVNQQLADRKTKVGFSAAFPIVHFSVGIARFNYDSLTRNGGDWQNLDRIFSINEDN